MSEKNERMKKSVVILRLFKYLFKHKVLLALAAVIMVTANLLALRGPELSGAAIDAIIDKGNVDFPLVYRYVFEIILVYLVYALLTFALSYLMIHISRKVVYAMRREAFEHLAELPVSYFDKNPPGDLISRLTYDIDTINSSLSDDLLQIGVGGITVMGCAVKMIGISAVLSLIFVVTVPCLIAFTIYRVKKVKPLFRKRSAKLGELNGYTEEMLSGQKIIRAYGVEKVMIDRFQKQNVEAVDAYYNADYQGSVIGPSVNFINNVSMSLISMFGGLLYLFGNFSLGNLSSFILYSRRFSGPISETANIISEIQSATSAAERVFRLLDEKPEDKIKPGDTPLNNISGNTEFREVKFSYTPDKQVINNISFKINPGSTVAIVGPTGGGKTTLVSLLMRFYDPSSGEITIDGRNTYRCPLDDVRKCFAMVLQDTWLFGGTLRENILYGNPNTTEEQLQKAVKAAKLEEFIASLPKGLDTVLEENGGNISKGQKQLITIARALLSDAPMLIFDEATSNVDSRTEAQLKAAMDAVMVGKTSFIVAHRLSTVQNADIILVIREGIIAESGTHDELLKLDGFYASLFKSQFESF